MDNVQLTPYPWHVTHCYIMSVTFTAVTAEPMLGTGLFAVLSVSPMWHGLMFALRGSFNGPVQDEGTMISMRNKTTGGGGVRV